MILLGTADFETPELKDRAEAVLHTAYAKTAHCEQFVREGFNQFIQSVYVPDRNPAQQAQITKNIERSNEHEKSGAPDSLKLIG